MIRSVLWLAFTAIASAQVPWIFVTSLPGLCRVGESYFVTTAAAGSQLFYCSSPNTYTAVGSGGGGGGGATALSGLTDLQTSRTSSTVLTIAAGSARIGTVVYTYSAATATLSGTSAASTAYVYVSAAGVLTVAHNGASTVTCSGCTTATGVTAFPVDSIPSSTATYTSATWDTSGVTDKRVLISRSTLAAGSGITIAEDSAGVQTISSSASAVTTQILLPWGFRRTTGGNNTSAFTANQTRWYLFSLPMKSSFTGVGVQTTAAMGASKGVRYAVADTSGTILHKTAVNTTNATGDIRAAFTSTITLDPGYYYLGVTTDSTSWATEQVRGGNEDGNSFCKLVDLGGTPKLAGTGTAGSGTAGTVDFGASMGTITSYVCNSGLNTLGQNSHDLYFY